MTTRQHKIGMTVTAAIVLAMGRAAADPAPPELTNYLHFQTPSHIVTDGGSKRDLPPGYFFDEPTFGKLDADVRALQDANTSKDAQIRVYRAELEKWQPGWVTLGAAVLGGFALGWYVHDKL